MDIKATGGTIEPKAWHGLLKLVAVEPAPIYVREDCGEVSLFFDPTRFDIDSEAMEKTLEGLAYGNCTGFNLDRLGGGDIRIYFNPVCHGPAEAHLVIAKVVETLCLGEG